ncbi:MAG: CHRD domain-containing protein [Kiloniellaceae bacterium]
MRTILTAGALAVATTALGADLAAAGARDFIADLARVREFVRADAGGQAKFRLSGDGRELRYELTVENLEAFTQAHIHLTPEAVIRDTLPRRFRKTSPKREHGPIVVILTDFIRGGIAVDGVLAKGVIRQADLVGPLKGHPLSLLIEFMEERDAYVALHVLKPIAPGHVFCCPVGLRGIVRAERSQ